MLEQKIKEIRKLAHSIDFRINLFDGYSPKKTASYKGELLFWRQVVSLYGLFVDCDRVQIKEKNNLMDLMKRYSLIERSDYDMALKFWGDVSELRKWFCHNNDDTLYYVEKRQKKIKNYLNSAFVLYSNKPERIEDVQQNDWNILTYDLDRRFQEYLDIVEKGFLAWVESDYKSELIDEWISIFAKALLATKELMQNVLADIATYEKMNQGIYNMTGCQNRA